MRVIVDTSVWSLALRRQRKDLSPQQKSLVLLLRDLIVIGDAILLGVVRQELLTGMASQVAFDTVRQQLHDFDDMPPDIATMSVPPAPRTRVPCMAYRRPLRTC